MVPRGTLLPAAPTASPRGVRPRLPRHRRTASLVSILAACAASVETVDFKRRANTSYSLSACVSNPMKILYFFVWVFNCIYAVITAVGTPFGPHDSKTAFCDTSKKVVYSGKRTMVNCPGFALSDLKEVKTKMGCTVNDVVCACLAGALHKYQEYRSDPRARRSSLVRAAIAIPFLGRAPGALCNDWTFVSLSLVMGPMSIVDRLKKTQRRCHLMKSTPGAHAVSARSASVARSSSSSFRRTPSTISCPGIPWCSPTSRDPPRRSRCSGTR